MNNQTNNENLSQGTNGQPDEYSAYREARCHSEDKFSFFTLP